MAKNADLNGAKNAKKDEFYTQLVDIENEVKHYRRHFEGTDAKAVCCIYTGKDSPPERRILEQGGSFRSEECLAFLKEADIVCTNPPFSKFRDFISLLMRHHKKFLVIGHQNAITYREIFPCVMRNEIWLGYGFKGGAGCFINKHYTDYAKAGDHREGMIRVSGVHWFTNLEHDKRHEDIPLYRHYTPEDFPKYDNYDAINVGKTSEIPCDYDGVMGVPITFMDKYSPDQFEIVGASESEGKGFSQGLWDEASGVAQPLVCGEKTYKRLFIRRRRKDSRVEMQSCRTRPFYASTTLHGQNREKERQDEDRDA